MSKATTYNSFIKTSEKIQRQITKKMEDLEKFQYSKKDKEEIHEMLERSSNIILKREFESYSEYVIRYNAEFLHFPNKKKNIHFLKDTIGLK